MQSLVLPRKSGIHRAACFALFRALFRQINRLGLAQLQRSTLESRLRKGIRDNLFQQSASEIQAALRQGYALLRVLHEGVQKPLNSPVHTFDFATIPIIRMPWPDPKTSSSLSRPSASESKSKATNRPRRGPMVWPQPNTPSIFDRPFRRVSGRRRVPHLVCTNGFPFLRIKRPQSQYLGRIIRDDVRLFQKRTERMWKLRDQTKFADDEERWDEILESTCDIKRDPGGGAWGAEVSMAKHQLTLGIQAHRQKRLDMARKMQDIVEKEQALADQEILQRKTEKHRDRKRRRLGRKAANSDESEDTDTDTDTSPMMRQVESLQI